MANVINATSTGNGGLVSTGDDSGILNIQTNETTAITVDASQRVGIGTASPTQALTVAGQMLSIASSGASFKNITPTTSNNYMWLGNTGNNLYVGKESSSGGSLFVGSSAYAGVIGNDGAYPLQFATNNTVQATIDSSGNLGLGVTPSAWTSAFKAIQLPTYGCLAQKTSNASEMLMAWNAYGGTTNTNVISSMNYRNTGDVASMYSMGGVHAWYIAPSGTAGNVISFTQAMTLDNSGNLLIGYTSSNGSYKLQVNSQIFATSSTIATSDARYKENVEELSGALDIVKSLRPVSFDWKVHPVHNFDTKTKTVGFLAQDVQQTLAGKPYLNSIIKTNECVIEPEVKDENGTVTKEAVTEEFLGIAEGNMISILTAAIKELKAEFDAYVIAHP